MQTKTIHYIPSVVQEATQIRMVAYARVSSSSEDQLLSYAAQLEHYERLMRENPTWELVDLYADEGITGTRADKRSDFQRLMQDCRKGLIDKIVTKSISRFSRNITDCLMCVRELKSLGVEVYFEKENLDTGDIGTELMLSFFGATAQEESLSIATSMRWSYQHRMRSGEFITCSAPYGYNLANGANIVVSPTTAAVVQYIFSQYLQGHGVETIARNLNELEVQPPQHGKKWHGTAVSRILENEKYTGNSILQKTYTADGFPFAQKRNHGERTQYFVQNSHEPIITKDTAEKAYELMALRRNRQKSTPQKYSFSLMIHCPECGATFKRRVIRDKVYWGCRNHDKRKEYCPVGRTPEIELEQAFICLHHKLRSYTHEILTPILEQLTTLKSRAVYQQTRISEIDALISDNGRQTMVLTSMFRKGQMDAAFFHTQNQRLVQELNSLRRERRHLMTSASDAAIGQTEDLISILRGSPERLSNFNEPLFKSMVTKMTITAHKQIHFLLINGLEVTECL